MINLLYRKKHNHLNLKKRHAIERLVQLGTSKMEITFELEVHVSTVYRELNRISDQSDQLYKVLLSDRKCLKRHRGKAKKSSFIPHMKSFIDRQLPQNLSPEQISGLALANGLLCTYHERFYQYIWCDTSSKWEL